MSVKLCNFYIEVKDLEDGDCKTFACGCRRHKGRDIVVVRINERFWELRT